MTLPPLKKVVLGGKWHIIAEIDLASESLTTTVDWLADMGDLIAEAIKRESYQRQHKVRVTNVAVHFPEMTGEGYDDVPQG